VPENVGVDAERLTLAGDESTIRAYKASVRVQDWTPLREVYPEGLPEQYKLKPGELGWVPIEAEGKTFKVPVFQGKTGPREFFSPERLERIGLEAEGESGWSRFFIASEKIQPGETSLFEKVSFTGRVKYESVKVFQQGGLPDLVLQQVPQEMGLRISGLPKVPVLTSTRLVSVPVPSPPRQQPQQLLLQQQFAEQQSGRRVPEDLFKVPVIEREREKSLPVPVPETIPKLPVISRDYTTPTPPAPGLSERWINVQGGRGTPGTVPGMSDILRTSPLEKVKPEHITPPIVREASTPTPRVTYPMPPKITLPGPPGFIGGTRDLPARNPQLWHRKSWRVEWFNEPRVPDFNLELEPRHRRSRSRKR
jgi:hypothetical protein